MFVAVVLHVDVACLTGKTDALNYISCNVGIAVFMSIQARTNCTSLHVHYERSPYHVVRVDQYECEKTKHIARARQMLQRVMPGEAHT